MSKIISAGNPILKNVAAPVEVFDKKLKFLVIDMKKTLYEANGVGLAAPQIAVSKRVFVADDGESGFEAYINPEWSPIGDEKNTDIEGCLSVPELFGEVERYSNVIVHYQIVSIYAIGSLLPLSSSSIDVYRSYGLSAARYFHVTAKTDE